MRKPFIVSGSVVNDQAMALAILFLSAPIASNDFTRRSTDIHIRSILSFYLLWK